ncbi:hypothetical protein VN12_23495 [Pirellula sp. SH-Sr6A]|uniref:ABC-three component system protein n=1 Tax=Pirellula sp. SH-Sr6A TaxID=1632865 RepID=UPI00078B32D4|nr:hypothetical protein VN12_23495 [Pirellula sp. SH-Sr6A]
MASSIAPITLPLPTSTGATPSDFVHAGRPIPAIERIRLFEPTAWEEFVLEWADSLRTEYERVERCGGAGDCGRDIIGISKCGTGQWDNYQCKHYRDPVTPTDIWLELGKLVYYTHQGVYTYPRKYSFVAPQGAGNKLSRLLRDPSLLKSQLIQNWDAYCRNGITSTGVISLDASLTTHLGQLDFSIFDAIPPLRIIDGHAKTRWHVARFGGGLPARPPIASPPSTPTAEEITYIRHLLEAYGSHLNRVIERLDDLSDDELKAHLLDSRREFYSAESLRAFSRDTLPPGEFEVLQDELHSGICDEVRGEHSNGYHRVLAVVRVARSLQLTAHALVSRLTVRDRGGICHQLANDNKLRWVK